MNLGFKYFKYIRVLYRMVVCYLYFKERVSILLVKVDYD